MIRQAVKDRVFLVSNKTMQDSSVGLPVTLAQPLVAEVGEHFEIALRKIKFFPSFITTIRPEYTKFQFTVQFGDNSVDATGTNPQTMWGIAFTIYLPQARWSIQETCEHINHEILLIWNHLYNSDQAFAPNHVFATPVYGSTYDIEYNPLQQNIYGYKWRNKYPQLAYYFEPTGNMAEVWDEDYGSTDYNKRTGIDIDETDGTGGFPEVLNRTKVPFTATKTQLHFADNIYTIEPIQFKFDTTTGGIVIEQNPNFASPSSTENLRNVTGYLNADSDNPEYFTISKMVVWNYHENPVETETGGYAAAEPCPVARYIYIDRNSLRQTCLWKAFGVKYSEPDLNEFAAIAADTNGGSMGITVMGPSYERIELNSQYWDLTTYNDYAGEYLTPLSADKASIEVDVYPHWFIPKYSNALPLLQTPLPRLPDFYPHNLFVNVDGIQEDQEQLGFGFTIPNGTLEAVPLRYSSLHILDSYIPNNMTFYRLTGKYIDNLRFHLHVDDRLHIKMDESAIYSVEMEVVIRTVFDEREAARGQNQTIRADPVIGFRRYREKANMLMRSPFTSQQQMEIIESLTSSRVANPSSADLFHAYPHLNIAEHLCFSVGQTYEGGPKVVEVFRILSEITIRVDTSALQIEWYAQPNQPPLRFWVKTGIILRKEIFGFIGKTSFRRSTFLYLPSFQCVRLHQIRHLYYPHYVPNYHHYSTIYIITQQNTYIPLNELIKYPWKTSFEKKEMSLLPPHIHQCIEDLHSYYSKSKGTLRNEIQDRLLQIIDKETVW